MDKQTSDTCRKDYEKMGLAASQARFLCLTARKAHCEYKSTALAQEKLNITNQMSLVANDYAQALNATKLVWQPDGMDGSYGLTYGLLMMPSAANDYDPYMVTTPSGAIVLNTAFMEAAKAAGIDKTGNPAALRKTDTNTRESLQDQRDKFISALIAQGLITDPTAKAITKNDYDAALDDNNSVTLTKVKDDEVSQVYNTNRGIGAEPQIKGGADVMTLSDIILSDKIGKLVIDWSQLAYKENKNAEGTALPTLVQYQTEVNRLKSLQKAATQGDTATIEKDIARQLEADKAAYIEIKRDPNNENWDPDVALASDDTYQKLNEAIEAAKGYSQLNSVQERADARSKILAHINKDLSDYQTKFGKYVNGVTENINGENKLIKLQGAGDVLNTTVNDLDWDEIRDSNNNKGRNFTIVVNGVINHYEQELQRMTLGDILSQNVVLMSNSKTPNGGNGTFGPEKFIEAATRMLDTFSGILGYDPTGTVNNQGLNVDDASSRALKFAYAMTLKTFLNKNDIEDIGSRPSDSSMTENSAYLNAVENNRIGELKKDNTDIYYALSLSNMMNAFLTYYVNGLEGAGSQYVVGKSLETSTLVTDNAGYKYIANENTEQIDMEEKVASFYDELFNNILEHGWRYDSSIDDNEYLETVLKNGRYSMCSLNQDGYYYQTRYNETGYMVEVADSDAIARAEAEFAAKKAELNYKEDTIDMKTKKLDAEIASIAAEVDSVKNIISKAIEKTFTMFSN